MKIVGSAAVQLYKAIRQTIFPGSSCRFYPTCSEYTTEAIRKHGIITVLKLGFLRIIRCNPLGSGGYDPVT